MWICVWWRRHFLIQDHWSLAVFLLFCARPLEMLGKMQLLWTIPHYLIKKRVSLLKSYSVVLISIKSPAAVITCAVNKLTCLTQSIRVLSLHICTTIKNNYSTFFQLNRRKKYNIKNQLAMVAEFTSQKTEWIQQSTAEALQQRHGKHLDQMQTWGLFCSEFKYDLRLPVGSGLV